MLPLETRTVNFLPLAGLISLGTVAAFLALRNFLKKSAHSLPGSHLAPSLLERPSGVREVLGWAIFCTALLLALDFRGFTTGFFRQDDFSFLQVAREYGSLGHQLLLYHNDHTLPLFRFEIWTLVSLAGPKCDSNTLAAWFNAANFITYLGVLLTVVWVLTEMGTRRLVIGATCGLLWLWPCWGEFTSGFYTLWMYPQCLALGLAAIAAWLRAARLGRGRWTIASLLFVVGGAALGVVGLWIFPAMAAVAWLHRVPRHGLLAASALFILGLTSFVFYTRLTEHTFSERERVQNPSASRAHSRIVSVLREHAAALPFGVLSSTGGAALSVGMPPVLKGLLSKVIVHRPLTRALIALESIVAIGLLVALWHAGRAMPLNERRNVVTLLLPLLVLTGMTIIARPTTMEWPALFWPAKYQCIPFTSCVLTVGFALHCTAFATDENARRTMRRLFQSVPLVVGLSILLSTFEAALHLDLPWFPGGREANVRFAQIRRAEHHRFVSDLTALAASIGQTSIKLPHLIGDHNAYPYLEIGANLTYGANYLVPDLLAASPTTPFSLVLTDGDQIDASIIRQLRETPELARLFLSSHATSAGP